MKVKEKLIVSTFNPDEIGTQMEFAGEISEEDVKRFRGYAERIAQKNALLVECLCYLTAFGDEDVDDLRERIENHLGISVDVSVESVN